MDVLGILKQSQLQQKQDIFQLLNGQEEWAVVGMKQQQLLLH